MIQASSNLLRFANYTVLISDSGEPLEIGAGAFGSIFIAEDTRDHSQVALKVIQDKLVNNASVRDRFKAEMREHGRLNHPGIVRIVGSGEQEGTLFYAMEYCRGGDLGKFIDKFGAIQPVQTLQIGRQIADALVYAHAYGICHRDLKPSNILLAQETQSGVLPLVKVSDFGLVKRTWQAGPSQMSHSGGYVGTIQFSSPEQIREEELDARSDVFSLGLTLWYLLVGAFPLTKDGRPLTTFELISDRTSDASYMDKFPGNIPLPVRDLLGKMLAKDREHRFENCGRLVMAFDDCLRELLDQPERGENSRPQQPSLDSSKLPPLKEFFSTAPAGQMSLGTLFDAKDLTTGLDAELLLLREELPTDALWQIKRNVASLTTSPHPSLSMVAFREFREGMALIRFLPPRFVQLFEQIAQSGPQKFSKIVTTLQSLASGIDHAYSLGLPGVEDDPRLISVQIHPDGSRFPIVSPKLCSPIQDPSGSTDEIVSNAGTLKSTDSLAGPLSFRPASSFASIAYWLLTARGAPGAAFLAAGAYLQVNGLSREANTILRESLCGNFTGTAHEVLHQLAASENYPLGSLHGQSAVGLRLVNPNPQSKASTSNPKIIPLPPDGRPRVIHPQQGTQESAPPIPPKPIIDLGLASVSLGGNKAVLQMALQAIEESEKDQLQRDTENRQLLEIEQEKRKQIEEELAEEKRAAEKARLMQAEIERKAREAEEAAAVALAEKTALAEKRAKELADQKLKEVEERNRKIQENSAKEAALAEKVAREEAERNRKAQEKLARDAALAEKKAKELQDQLDRQKKLEEERQRVRKEEDAARAKREEEAKSLLTQEERAAAELVKRREEAERAAAAAERAREAAAQRAEQEERAKTAAANRAAEEKAAKAAAAKRLEDEKIAKREAQERERAEREALRLAELRTKQEEKATAAAIKRAEAERQSALEAARTIGTDTNPSTRRSPVGIALVSLTIISLLGFGFWHFSIQKPAVVDPVLVVDTVKPQNPVDAPPPLKFWKISILGYADVTTFKYTPPKGFEMDVNSNGELKLRQLQIEASIPTKIAFSVDGENFQIPLNGSKEVSEFTVPPNLEIAIARPDPAWTLKLLRDGVQSKSILADRAILALRVPPGEYQMQWCYNATQVGAAAQWISIVSPDNKDTKETVKVPGAAIQLNVPISKWQGCLHQVYKTQAHWATGNDISYDANASEISKLAWDYFATSTRYIVYDAGSLPALTIVEPRYSKLNETWLPWFYQYFFSALHYFATDDRALKCLNAMAEAPKFATAVATMQELHQRFCKFKQWNQVDIFKVGEYEDSPVKGFESFLDTCAKIGEFYVTKFEMEKTEHGKIKIYDEYWALMNGDWALKQLLSPKITEFSPWTKDGKVNQNRSSQSADLNKSLRVIPWAAAYDQYVVVQREISNLPLAKNTAQWAALTDWVETSAKGSPRLNICGVTKAGDVILPMKHPFPHKDKLGAEEYPLIHISRLTASSTIDNSVISNSELVDIPMMRGSFSLMTHTKN